MEFAYPTPLTLHEVSERCWKLHIKCKACGRSVFHPPQAFGAPGAQVKALAERLKCSACGSREGSVNLQNDPSASHRKDMERIRKFGK